MDSCGTHQRICDNLNLGGRYHCLSFFGSGNESNLRLTGSSEYIRYRAVFRVHVFHGVYHNRADELIEFVEIRSY